MRVKIEDFDSKKDLFKYLRDNKSELIARKKSMPIVSDVCGAGIMHLNNKAGGAIKANTPVEENVDKLRVKVVANTANWIDSHMDMLLPDAAAKSINERKGIIPHLHDHIHQVGAKVGEVVDIQLQNLSLTELGVNKMGMTQAIVFITDIIKDYNPQVFNQYKEGRINQHSIGMQYVKLDLAINDDSSTKEFEYWEKNIELAINPEAAEERGFFWVVSEIKLIENSAVLFGSNEITPTLDNNLKNITAVESDTVKTEPSDDTQSNNSMFNFKNLI
jgi:hypothetical protein